MSVDLETLVISLDATTDLFRKEMAKADSALERHQRKAQQMQVAVERTFARLGAAAGVYLGANLAKGLLEGARSIERLNAQLTTATGSAKGAAQAMAMLRQMSFEQSVSLTDLADGFNRLLPSVKSGIINFSEMQKVLRLTTDNAKAFGLQSSETQGLFLGLSQTLGSGTVTMEDLRQVTDRLPGTLNDMSAAMGMSVGQFKEFIATGQVTTDKILPALLEAFQKNEGAASKMGDTFDSAMARMENAFTDLGDAIGQSGLLDALTEGVKILTAQIDILSLSVVGFQKAYYALTADTEGYTKANDRAAQIMARLGGEYEAGTDALDGLGKSSAQATVATTKLSAEQKKAMREQEKARKEAERMAEALRSGIDTLYDQQLYEKTVQGMSDVEKATFDTQTRIRELTGEYGKLNDEQRLQAQSIVILSRENAIHAKYLDDVADNTRKWREAQEQLREELQEPFKNALQEIQGALSGTFEGIFDGSIDSASDAAGAIKRIFIKLAAELAALAVFRPQVLASGGVSGLAGAAVNGSSTMGMFSGASNMMSAASLTTSLLPSGLAGSIDSLANSMFGIGDLVKGPFTGGEAFTEGVVNGFSKSFNVANIGAGIAGSVLSSKIFGEGTGNSVGSAVGGLGAGALAAGLSLGPLGAAALVFGGSFLGGGLGSIFNSKPSSKEQVAAIDLATGQNLGYGGLTGKKFDPENRDKADELSKLLASITMSLGTFDKAMEAGVSAVINNRDGVGFEFGPNVERQMFRSADALIRAFVITIDEKFPGKVSDSVEKALTRIDFSNVEQALADLQFAANFDSLNFDNIGKLPETFTEAEAAVKAVKDTFAELTTTTNENLNGLLKTATRLDLETGKLTKAQADAAVALSQGLNRALQQLSDGFNKTVRDDLLGSLAPEASAIAGEVARYQQQIKDALVLGADTRVVDQLHNARMAELTKTLNQQQIAGLTEQVSLASGLANTLRGLQNTYQGLLDSMTTGTMSGLNPVARLQAQRAEIESLRNPAALGDVTAQQRLAELIPAFLELSGSVNGYNADFAADQRLTLSITQTTKSVIDRQLTVQESIAAAAQKQIEVMQKGFSELLAGAGGSGKNAAGRSLYETSTYGLNVGQIEAIGRSLTGYTGASGSGQINAELALQGKLQQFDALLRKAAGLPGYATGGLISGGVQGRDSVPVMTMPGEFVVRAGAVRSLGLENMASMNQTGQLPGNDNALLAEVRALREQVAGLTRVTAAGGDQNTSGLQGVQRQLGRIISDGALAQWA